tara:strand:+ start:96 stop:338 length:243 start_codon:yes stop_codon:yes gene_type:complete
VRNPLFSAILNLVTILDYKGIKMKLPKVTPELLEYLSTIYPDQYPSKGATIEEIYIGMGQVSVIRKLRLLLNEQQDNLLG